MTKTKFRNLSGKTKGFRVLNLSLNYIIIIFTVALAVYYFITSNPNSRQYASLGVAGFSFLPIIFELFSKSRLPNFLYLFINIYIIFAGVWGSALSGYQTFVWFDVVIHTFMGYFAGMIGLFLLCFLDEERKMKIITVALFCLCFSLFIECIWEIFEYVVDIIRPVMEMQGENVPGYNFPLVQDTMEDIICNLSGAIIFFVHYIIAKKSKKNLLISSMTDDFSIHDKIIIKEEKK